ncbi:MAG: hypothetical protein QM758_07470 [Armatimonas sp.]
MTTTRTHMNPEREDFYSALNDFLSKIAPQPEPQRGAPLPSFLDEPEDSLFNPPLEWYRPGEQPGGWNTIRATFDRALTATEVMEAAGCIGYALRINVAAGRLSLPVLEAADDHKTVLSFSYDSIKSERWMPSVVRAFREAARYIVEGTPRRTTNRAGLGTAGTPLCDGIGPVGVEFHLR